MGGFDKKTIRDINVKGKRVLLRADYNVPLVGGKVAEDYRIRASLPTIQYLLEHGCKGLVIISHLGRPKGQRDSSLSLKPVAEHLQKLLGQPVGFTSDCIGEAAEVAAAALKAGDILLLENLRFHPGEEANDLDFAKQLVQTSAAEIFVQDGFGVVHRAHASTSTIPKLLPSVAGLLLEKEVSTITDFMKNPKRPLTAVIAGAKVSDKIELIERFIELADCVAIGGAMANNFLAAGGYHLGKSIVETGLVAKTKGIIKLARAAERQRAFNFLVPTDVVVSTAVDGVHPTRVVDFGAHLADIEAYPKLPRPSSYEVAADEMILDLGPTSAARIAGAVQMSRSVIWNGTLGVTETKPIATTAAPFSHGTEVVVTAMIGPSRQHKNKPISFAGGGDTVSYIEQNKLLDDFDFVSTGGGATLELMAGHKLPGVEALQDKH